MEQEEKACAAVAFTDARPARDGPLTVMDMMIRNSKRYRKFREQRLRWMQECGWLHNLREYPWTQSDFRSTECSKTCFRKAITADMLKMEECTVTERVSVRLALDATRCIIDQIEATSPGGRVTATDCSMKYVHCDGTCLLTSCKVFLGVHTKGTAVVGESDAGSICAKSLRATAVVLKHDIVVEEDCILNVVNARDVEVDGELTMYKCDVRNVDCCNEVLMASHVKAQEIIVRKSKKKKAQTEEKEEEDQGRPLRWGESAIAVTSGPPGRSNVLYSNVDSIKRRRGPVVQVIQESRIQMIRFVGWEEEGRVELDDTSWVGKVKKGKFKSYRKRPKKKPVIRPDSSHMPPFSLASLMPLPEPEQPKRKKRRVVVYELDE